MTTSIPSIPAQARAIALRDLRRERRRGEVLWITVPFGAVALLLIPLAVGTDAALLERIGSGLFWVIVMLFGVLVAVRQAAAETQQQRDSLALLGLDPAAGFAGRAGSAALLLLVFEVITGVVAVVLYDVPLEGVAWLVVILPLVAVGLGMLGAIAAGIVAWGRGGTALVPFLVAPLSVPLLLSATQAFEGLRLGESILSWIVLMVVVVIVLAIIGTLTARPLQEIR